MDTGSGPRTATADNRPRTATADNRTDRREEQCGTADLSGAGQNLGGPAFPGAETWEWLRRAACVDADPELFFPVGESGPAAAQAERAKRVCHSCPVEEQCLQWALNTSRTTGVWGGTDEEERRRLRRRGDRRRPAQGATARGRQQSAPGRSRRP
jgi:WhiB family redox-sensing transcriptional regulator